MKKIVSVIIAGVLTATLFSGCNAVTENEDKDNISVYLWSTVLYDNFAPYIQSKLPDVNIQFVVGNNDLDFYKFMNENGKLPGEGQGTVLYPACTEKVCCEAVSFS